MATVMPTEPVVDAILARLTAVIVTGDHKTPTGIALTAQKLPALAYAILYEVDPLGAEGSLGDATQMETRQYQVTVIGGTRAQAQFGQNLVRTQLVGWVPTVSGRGFEPMQLHDPSGVEPDTDPTPPLFFTVDRFRLFVT